MQEKYPQAYEGVFGRGAYRSHKKSYSDFRRKGTFNGKKPYVWETLKNLMGNARERVVLHTPYAVLDSQMETGMKAIAENVDDFKMIINSVENGDNIVASSDYRIHKKDIIDTGVELYEFDGGDSTHGKSVLIDNDMAHYRFV